MVFCNKDSIDTDPGYNQVTILILVDGFLQSLADFWRVDNKHVTILILVDGFLQ